MTFNQDNNLAVDYDQELAQVENLGQLLKLKREKLGLTLQQVNQETKIAKVCLEAFENNIFDQIPNAYDWEIVYLKSYLLKYAKLLGLDPKWVEEKAYDSASLQKKAQQERISQIVSQEAASSSQMRNMTSSDAHFGNKPRGLGVAWALLFILVVALVAVFVYKNSVSEQVTEVKQITPSVLQEQEVKVEQEVSNPQKEEVQEQQPTVQDPVPQELPATAETNKIPEVGLYVACQTQISFSLYTKERKLELVECKPDAPFVLNIKANMSLNFLNKPLKDVTIYFNGKPQQAKNLLNLSSSL